MDPQQSVLFLQAILLTYPRENVGVPLPKKIPPTLETISKWGVCTCKVFPDMWTYACRGIITICYLQQMQAAMGTRVACNSYTSMENLGASPPQYHIRAFNGNLTKKMLKLSPPKIPVSPNIIWTLPFRAPHSSNEVLFAIATQSPTIVNKKMVLRVLICVWIFVSAVGEAVGEIVPAGLNMTHVTWWQTTHLLNPGNSCNLIFGQPPLLGDFGNEGMMQTLLQE